MSNKKLILLSVASGILFSISWSKTISGLTMLIAFIPLLFVEDYLYKNKHKLSSFLAFIYSFISFITWHLISTWWLYKASFLGAIIVVTTNSVIMASCFWLFHYSRKILSNKSGYLIFIIYWLAFEYMHIYWELSWPWMNLGNWLATNIKIIQWYEFTGSLGGSLWILLSNVILFHIIIKYIEFQKIKPLTPYIIIWSLLIIIPVAISLSLFTNYKEDKTNKYNIVLVQPNIDPYIEKYNAKLSKKQLNDMLFLADSKTNNTSDFVVFPESSIPVTLWEDSINNHESFDLIYKYVNKYDKLKFVAGLYTLKNFTKHSNIPKTALTDKKKNIIFDRYNTVIQIDKSKKIQFYHKSKFVIGAEKMPFSNTLKFLEKFAINFGGFVGSIGSDQERNVFESDNNKAKIAPVICYESIYGQFVTEYIKKGANIIFVITNDGWWGDTQGYKQHLTYSQLRAIETRRSVARSANTGISCFINQCGEILQATKWWKSDAINGSLYTNDKITIYVLYGDYIGRVSAFVAVLIILLVLVRKIRS